MRPATDVPHLFVIFRSYSFNIEVVLMPSILYAVPLAAVISLVYCTTRYELPARIYQTSTVMFIKTIFGLAVLYGVLWYFSS